MKLNTVFTDFDGTLTHGSELGSIFFDILKLLEKKNIPLVIVTGRSLSWGHFLLSHFGSLKIVIVEGGAIILERSGNDIKEELMIDQFEIDRLQTFTKKLQIEFPNLRLSADSWGRKADRAVELSDLKKDNILFNALKAYLSENKIYFSCSNVHLNFWCGQISKFSAVKYYSKKIAINLDDCLYFGDSLNDEDMFENLKSTIGVSNISSVLGQLKFRPQVILEGKHNEGPFGVLSYLKSIID